MSDYFIIKMRYRIEKLIIKNMGAFYDSDLV